MPVEGGVLLLEKPIREFIMPCVHVIGVPYWAEWGKENASVRDGFQFVFQRCSYWNIVQSA